VGGRFVEGEVMARIDARDYLLAIEVEKGRVRQAELEFELEAGRGEVARREWELLGNGRPASEAPLALREPHLQTAAQNLEGARSSLKRAELALGRTTLRAPFNAIVVVERIDVGQVVGPGGPIITLYGTDRFWVQVSVPVEKLSVLDIPGMNSPNGSLATVTLGTGVTDDVARTGQVVGIAGQLEPQTRMAQLLVAVEAPLDEPPGALPLLTGSFVDVTLSGRSLRHTVEVPRTAVTDGNRVWIVTTEGTLARRTVEIGWRDATALYVSDGLVPGERVVTSPIAMPLVGLPVRTADDATAGLPEPDGQPDREVGR